MPWLGRWAREARLARTAGNIGDPVLRLRFLRTAGPRASFVRRLAHGELRHWIFWAGLLLVLLIPFLMKLAAGKPEPLHDAPMPPHRAPAGEAQKTVPVWQVEQTGDSEVYSNGLRIDTRFTVANRPRLYTAFQRDGTSSVSRVRRSQPSGIVYHTTESCQAPFEAQDTPVLKRLGESLLELSPGKRSSGKCAHPIGIPLANARGSDQSRERKRASPDDGTSTNTASSAYPRPAAQSRSCGPSSTASAAG